MALWCYQTIHLVEPGWLPAVGCALSHVPAARSMELAMAALDRPMDRYLDYALKNTAGALGPSWLPALESGELTFGRSARKIEFALQAVKSPGVVKPLLLLAKTGKVARA